MNMQFCTPTGFGSPYGFPQGQGPTVTYADPQYQLHPSYSGLQYMYGYQTHRPPMMADRGLCDGKTESKPRLSKEEVEKLEKVFQENPKPSSSVKAQLADGLGLERPRINNWFQNRRAKAKQERKQEEYEARRAAEKSASEPSSPDEDSTGHLDTLSEGSQKRTQPSSAAFPNVSSPSQITNTAHEDENDESDDDDENENEENENANQEIKDANSVCINSTVSTTQADFPETYQSPISVEFQQSDSAGFSQPQGYLQARSLSSDFGMFTSPLSHGPAGDLHVERSMSSDGHRSQHYASMHTMAISDPSTRAMYFSPVSNGDSCDMAENPFDASTSPECHNDQTSHVIAQGMPTPTDSFKSPPPPANIASRRNIPRPATLQAASLRSRSFNIPKTALDGPKRMDISSPVASIRRISSATGMSAGRIQKFSAGPRSPFFGRAEALLQYHNRSPVGSGTPTFPGAAPPTPMTPALFDQHHNREPTVISTSSDDGSFVLGMGVTPNFAQDVKEEHDLKTPPTTPGMMGDFNTNGFVGATFGSAFNITTDQPLLTPYFQSEFPELSLQTVPGYVETSDASPSTPVYANMLGSGLEHHPFTGNAMANTQYDWDANESVVSSRSSPGYPRSKQIQFTPNMTPQDYH
ncbi:hypothetical protein F5B22DRAFT_448982 [Xylaria bambusicola]|uniref:uncharacterized protein n=1 Tax=Xylaria bambusicola TaxID=326684 RepID=UPI002007DAC8|nr:uncharacterized protein F5B22DRAFT_448982 [Xylaria bambusicola]KAI0506461.1 hypothetical protein F5B22DRAFT_448982 [Xylaria bambusicola]